MTAYAFRGAIDFVETCSAVAEFVLASPVASSSWFASKGRWKELRPFVPSMATAECYSILISAEGPDDPDALEVSVVVPGDLGIGGVAILRVGTFLNHHPNPNLHFLSDLFARTRAPQAYLVNGEAQTMLRSAWPISQTSDEYDRVLAIDPQVFSERIVWLTGTYALWFPPNSALSNSLPELRNGATDIFEFESGSWYTPRSAETVHAIESANRFTPLEERRWFS